jgi:hypothetical protein
VSVRDAVVTRDGSGSVSGALETGRVRRHTVFIRLIAFTL